MPAMQLSSLKTYEEVELSKDVELTTAPVQEYEADNQQSQWRARTICCLLGVVVGGCLTMIAMSEQSSSSVAIAGSSQTQGWLIERLFHTDAVRCPWTTTPADDADCSWRQTTIERLRGAMGTCTNPVRRCHTASHSACSSPLAPARAQHQELFASRRCTGRS